MATTTIISMRVNPWLPETSRRGRVRRWLRVAARMPGRVAAAVPPESKKAATAVHAVPGEVHVKLERLRSAPDGRYFLRGLNFVRGQLRPDGGCHRSQAGWAISVAPGPRRPGERG